MTLRKRAANVVRRLLRTAGFRAVTRIVRGQPLRIPLAMGELRSLLFDRSYSPFFNEHDVMDALVARMRPEDVVYDIGAYHGVWAVLIARHARAVVAFEPNPGTFRVLQETLALNRARNVSAHAVAVGGASSLADLWGSGSGASLRPGALRPLRSRVKMETLDEFAEREATLPDVMKIDVEGAEHEVLSAAQRCLAHARLVFIEVHFDELPKFGADYAMVEAMMTGSGFVEAFRHRPERGGIADPSRLHVVFERSAFL